MVVRTDDDTWDLATSVGATATLVASQRALASAGSHPLINDPYAAPLVRAVGMPQFIQLIEGTLPIPADLASNLDREVKNMAVRTRFFDQYFLEATRVGIRQVVILASGLDSRAYRLSWPEGTVVYEVDMPAVIDFKTTTLEDLGVSPCVERRTVRIDLRDDWASALQERGFDPCQPTAWSAEGLVIYLPPRAQDELCDTITTLSAPTSQLAADFITDMSVFTTPEWKSRQEETKKIGLDVNFESLIYHDPRNDLADYLAERRWKVWSRPLRDFFIDNGFIDPDEPIHWAFSVVQYCQAVLS